MNNKIEDDPLLTFDFKFDDTNLNLLNSEDTNNNSNNLSERNSNSTVVINKNESVDEKGEWVDNNGVLEYDKELPT